MSSLSKSASVNYNHKRRSKDWRYRTRKHGYVESRRELVRLEEELSLKEKVLRNAQIRSMHEMGDMKRGQEPQVAEVSVLKLRENHVTIQKLTSQLQQMQEQMNSMTHLGDIQDVESNFCGRLSHVSSPACNDSKFSFLAQPRQTLCLMTHGIHLDYRKTFMVINFYV